MSKRWSSKAAAAPPPPPQVNAGAQQRIETFIANTIRSNNLLGLTSNDITAAATTIATCAAKQEVFNWCETFMLGEAAAAEIIKLRDNIGPYFEGCQPRVSPAVEAVAAATSHGLSSLPPTAGGKKRPAKKAISELSGAKPLVEGVTFECGCFALSHPFIGNCLNCGRTFCKQESMIACYHCGFEPNRCIAYEIKVQTGLIDSAAQQKNASGYDQALEKRNQLLKYAKEKSKRTTVIDDQSGVFLESRNNIWLSKDERAEAETLESSERKRKVAEMHKRSGAYTIHLDIVNQNVALGARVEDVSGPAPLATSSAVAKGTNDEESTCSDSESDEESRVVANPAVLQKIWYSPDGAHLQKANQKPNEERKAPTARVIHESLRVQNDYYAEDELYWAQKKVETLFDGEEKKESLFHFSVPALPLMDVAPAAPQGSASSEMIEHFVERAEEERSGGVTKAMRSKDDMMCLSMHQPWASLLVAGIKTHEGRTWPTEYRGRLWIHSAAAKPTDISSVESHYTKFCSPHKTFPDHYPTSCLIGYVYVVDCLDNSQYNARFNADERQEDSPYKFICAEGKQLPFPLQMDGKHKIFKMDRKLWISAKQQLKEKI